MLIFTFQSINQTSRIHVENLARIITITTSFKDQNKSFKLKIKNQQNSISYSALQLLDLKKLLTHTWIQETKHLKLNLTRANSKKNRIQKSLF